MARTTATIEKAIKDSISSVNPSIDTVKGPVPEIFVIPQAAQFRSTELAIDDLSRRYSLDYILTRNTASLQLYGSNVGIPQSSGKPASGYVTFYTYTRLSLSESIVVPAGTVVTTTDPSIGYQTIKTITILGSNIDTYYNASKRRYEILAPIQSLGTGTAFEVPPHRIRLLRTAIEGIDGVENTAYVSGSKAAETNAAYGKRIRTTFNGTALGSGSGLKQLVLNYDPVRIQDTVVVFSSDLTLFKRWSRYNAWDVYVIGEDEETTTDLFVGDGFTKDFILLNQPSTSVSSVLVNNVASDFVFVPDISEQTGVSTRSTSKVSLVSTPVLDADISVTYTYNKLLVDINTYITTAGKDLFQSDILIRSANTVRVRTTVEIQILSSFDETQAISDTFAIVSSFLNPGTFVENNILYPDALRNLISGTVGGVSNIIITEFTKADTGVIPIEAIEFSTIEYPIAEDSLITILVRN
jgi:hypothetical protein